MIDTRYRVYVGYVWGLLDEFNFLYMFPLSMFILDHIIKKKYCIIFVKLLFLTEW